LKGKDPKKEKRLVKLMNHEEHTLAIEDFLSSYTDQQLTISPI